MSLGFYDESVISALKQMEAQRVVERIWAHDHTVWKPEPTEISNRLGWLDIIEPMRDEIPRMQALIESLQEDGYTQALLLGMGGSSLAPEVFRKVFGVRAGFLDLAILDSTDPAAVLAYAEKLDLPNTLFIVSTKSGGTVETLSFFKYFYNLMLAEVGVDVVGDHFIAITDPGSKLEKTAQEYRFREVFLNDSNIGGRYSALSFFGLLPAALLGVDIQLLLDRALGAATIFKVGTNLTSVINLPASLGAWIAESAKAGKDKLTLVLSPGIASFADWVEQLIAESTGKEGIGILPVVGERIGAPDLYGRDRLIVYLRLNGNGAYDEGVRELELAGHSVLTSYLKDPYDLGSQFFGWESATAVAGHLLGINPFDQPNVESAKVLARQMVAAYRERGKLPETVPTLVDDGISVFGNTTASNIKEALLKFLDQSQPDGYVALQAYLQPTIKTDSALQELRTQIRKWTKLATTVGYGPRFLHSTGQLHKGDAGHGLFIQLTADDPQDLDIPDEAGNDASSITFGILKMAQALGDAKALGDAGRKVIRFDLGQDIEAGIARLLEAF